MTGARARIFYLWKKWSEKQARKKLAAGYFKPDLDRFAACTARKPASRIRRETAALQQYWGCYPFQYFRFDFYRADCALSLEEMKTYVPLFFLDALFYPVNQGGYNFLSSDKLMNYIWLKAYNIPQAPLLLCFDNNTFFDSTSSRITPAAADTILAAAQAAKLFVKARQGSGGKGVQVFKKNAAVYTNNEGVVLNAAYFQKGLKSGRYIVQQGLVQHESLNRIYPHSINTFRVITENKGGEARVLFALLRIGQGGNQVDNASAGGMYVAVNTADGRLSHFAYAYNRKQYKTHPDTGFVFEGAQLPEWDAVKTFTLAAAEKLREMPYIGWDIGFTQNGPAVIEFNNSPDMGMIQDFYGGVRDALHIDPKAWWHRTRFTLH